MIMHDDEYSPLPVEKGRGWSTMFVNLCCILFLLSVYGIFFTLQESRFSESSQHLSYPLPPSIQKISLGYLRQLGSEILFIKASVFHGGLKPGRDPLEYAEPLARHFTAAASLHPQFIDTYFLCEATLPRISAEYAEYANSVLAEGITALPDNFVLPFFAGFNHFYYLDDPLEAARLFRMAANLPQGPRILEHLANLLTAEGGDIYAALIGLRAMYSAERDEGVKKRYEQEIVTFEKAEAVLNAIKLYEQTNNRPPFTLEELVPDYLREIPDIGPDFKLEWIPPHLRVVRLVKRPAA